MAAYLDKWIEHVRGQLALAEAMPEATVSDVQAKHDHLDSVLASALMSLRAGQLG